MDFQGLFGTATHASSRIGAARSEIVRRIVQSQFVHAVGLSSLLTALRILLGIVSTKVVAIYAGPIGVAAIGQLQNFIGLSGTIASAGISQGVVKYTAEYRDEANRRRSLLATAVALTLACSLPTALLTYLFRHSLAEDLLGSADLSNVFTYAALAISVGGVAAVVGSALNGLLMVGRMIVIGMIGTVLSFCLMMVLVTTLQAEGAMITTTVAGIIGSILTFAAAFCLGWMKPGDFLGSVNRADLKRLLAFALMAIVTGVATPLVLLLIRRSMVEHHGIHQAGLWQAVWRISEIYIQAITIPLASYYVPRIAGSRGTGEIRTVVARGMAFILPVTAIMATTIFILRDFIIHVLYTPDFLGMRDLFAYQLIGDVFRIAFMMLSMVMLARAMTRSYILADVAFHILFLAIALLAVPYVGAGGATLAFATASFLSFISLATWLLVRKDSVLGAAHDAGKSGA